MENYQPSTDEQVKERMDLKDTFITNAQANNLIPSESNDKPCSTCSGKSSGPSTYVYAIGHIEPRLRNKGVNMLHQPSYVPYSDEKGNVCILNILKRLSTANFKCASLQSLRVLGCVVAICYLGIAAAYAQSPSHWPPTQEDLNMLAQRFRPYIKFSTGDRQESRPVTWQYLYQNSSLMKGDQVIVPLGGLSGNDANRVLQYADITKGPQAAQSALNYRLKIDESHNAQYGEGWAQAEQGDGLYAHVTYLKNVTGQVPSANLVNIEYWLLLGSNVGPSVGVDDHQGDLIGVQVVYDHVSDKLVRVTFSEHGTSLIMFDLVHSKPPTDAVLDGKNDQGAHIKQAACKVEAQDHGFYSGGTGMTKGGDHHLFLVRDPVTNRCEHVALYLEHGSHEPWPNQSGWFVFVASHNGDDISYLPTTVHVLGPEDAPFMNFGGFLGNSDGPAGIMFHRMWLGYNRTKPADRDPYVDEGSLKWLPTLTANE